MLKLCNFIYYISWTQKHIFVDDTALLYVRVEEIIQPLQNDFNVDLHKFNNWFKQNHLLLNTNKTVTMLLNQKIDKFSFEYEN